jgi:hypothetical protein
MSEQATLPTLTKKRGRKIKRSKTTKISRGGRDSPARKKKPLNEKELKRPHG